MSWPSPMFPNTPRMPIHGYRQAYPGVSPFPLPPSTPAPMPLRAPVSVAPAAPPPAPPDDIPPQNTDLQKQFPGLYARLTNHDSLSERLRGFRDSAKAVRNVGSLSPARDHELVALDDNMKRAGSVTIATLATLGLKQRIFGIGEYLGMMSWLGAMAVTPHIVNGLVRLKTGVDLSQKYDSTYGQRQNLYKDPNYLPLHILPEKTIDKAAERLGIPPGPSRRQQVEDKMRQISVQAHTGWMLISGPATPVISGLACDALQSPVTRLWNQARLRLAMRAAHAHNGNPAALANKTHVVLQRMVGELPESELSSWWHDFGSGIVDKSGIGRHLSVKDVTQSDHATLANRIATFFGRSNALRPEKELTETLAYLDRQHHQDPATGAVSGKLEDLRRRAMAFLEPYRARLPEAEWRKQTLMVEDRIQNAQSTITHYRDMLKSAQASFGKDLGADRLVRKRDATDAVTRWMRNTHYKALSEMLEGGRVEDAKKLAGRENPKIFEKIRLAGAQRGAALMGATPEGHLIRALKEIKLGNLWRGRMVGWMGGGMLAASALYTWLCVGSEYNDPHASGGAS